MAYKKSSNARYEKCCSTGQATCLSTTKKNMQSRYRDTNAPSAHTTPITKKAGKSMIQAFTESPTTKYRMKRNKVNKKQQQQIVNGAPATENTTRNMS